MVSWQLQSQSEPSHDGICQLLREKMGGAEEPSKGGPLDPDWEWHVSCAYSDKDAFISLTEVTVVSQM